VVAYWILNENSTQRELTHTTHVNSRRGIFNFYFRNERNCLSKEQLSKKVIITPISILALLEIQSNYWILSGYWSWYLHHLHTSSLMTRDETWFS